MAPLILVRPHTSLLDGPYTAWRLRDRPCVFPVDSDYARHPLWGRMLRAYGWLLGHRMIALDVARPLAIRTVLNVLRNGETVVLFPQGTGLSDPQRPDQPGTLWLLRRAGVLAEHWRLEHWRGIPVSLVRTPEIAERFHSPLPSPPRHPCQQNIDQVNSCR